MMGAMGIAAIVLIVLLTVGAVLAATLVVAVRNQRIGVTRRTHDPAIDPFRVGEPWRRLVQGAVRAQSRYRQTLASTQPGPMHDRLAEIGTHLDDAVSECWRIAQRGYELRHALDAMDIARSREQLAAIPADAKDPDLVQRAAALSSRVSAYDRIAATTAQTEQELRLLVARLEETSARGAELSLTAGAPGVDALGQEVSGVVDELESLRLAFDELGARPELPPA
jgi:hypothetical protein